MSHSVTPFAYDANAHLVATLMPCRQRPTLHVNGAQCLNGHITNNSRRRLPSYCTTPLSLQLTFSAHSPAQHERCLGLTLTTHEHPLPSTCRGERSMSQAGEGSMNINTMQPPTLATATTTRECLHVLHLSTIHMTSLTSRGCTAVSIDTCIALARFISHFV